MRKICGILSWFIWLMGAIMVSSLVYFAPRILEEAKLKLNATASSNPVQDYGLGGVMILFSLAATFLRYRIFMKSKRANIDEMGGFFFWLCLLSFAVCFGTAAAGLGIQRCISESQIQPIYLLGSGSVLCLLACLPFLPKAKQG